MLFIKHYYKINVCYNVKVKFTLKHVPIDACTLHIVKRLKKNSHKVIV